MTAAAGFDLLPPLISTENVTKLKKKQTTQSVQAVLVSSETDIGITDNRSLMSDGC